MLTNLTIENFRGFQQFHMHNLGNVNLLVGTNNSGKTTVLEAIELLASRGNLRPLWAVMDRRGEQVWHDDDRKETEADISHLFHGHDFDIGSAVKISATREGDPIAFTLAIGKRTRGVPREETDAGQAEGYLGALQLKVCWDSQERSRAEGVPLTSSGGVAQKRLLRWSLRERADEKPVRYITTAAMSVDDIVSLFDEIVLTPEEEILIESLQTIDESIERIASVSSARHRSYSRGGIVLKCQGAKQRIPIGTMGDGMWRMLGLAIALSTSENGIVLVDEIDTGLHYSVMADMWRLVKKTAERLNVQVFATTHSRDCYESLASISSEAVSEESQVTIQRIEPGKDTATAFTEREIVIAADRGLEVR